MTSFTVCIYHNKNLSLNEIESLFIPIFGQIYSYAILLNLSNHLWCAYINNNLHTECTNELAIKFYKKFHFHIDLFVENYYETMLTFYPHTFEMSRKF